MAKILLATSNPGKIAELHSALEDYGLTVLGLQDFPQLDEVEENGETFAENALLKARHGAKATGLVTIADDSGLIVDFLEDQPGVRSARFAEELPFLEGENRDQRNIRKLLAIMQGVRQRGCAFVTAMACVKPSGEKLLTRGEWRGRLLESPRGSNGFGYDPVFFDAETGKAAAELARAEKNARSHRGKALRELLARLPEFLDLPLRGL